MNKEGEKMDPLKKYEEDYFHAVLAGLVFLLVFLQMCVVHIAFGGASVVFEFAIRFIAICELLSSVVVVITGIRLRLFGAKLAK